VEIVIFDFGYLISGGKGNCKAGKEKLSFCTTPSHTHTALSHLYSYSNISIYPPHIPPHIQSQCPKYDNKRFTTTRLLVLISTNKQNKTRCAL